MGGSGEGLIRAAVEGTRRVIAAGVAAGARRIVMTSSTAACTPDAPLGRPIDESDWTDPHQPDLSDYRRSKVLAERAAWDAVSGSQTELVTILPGAIFGPVRDKGHLSSVAFIARPLAGQPAALPRLGFNIIDVRDLSALHLAALAAPEAAGRRFIAIGEALWYADIARTLRERLGEPAAKVPTADLPDDTFRALAQSNAEMAALLPLLGRTQAFSSDAARQVLSFAPRPPQDTVADAGASLL
jgi:dihydroflavonol-4-reductase